MSFDSIPLKPVESKNVAAIGYDPATSTLAVQFKHGAGAIYHYPGVSADLHDKIHKAESIGKFVTANVVKAFPKFTKHMPPK